MHRAQRELDAPFSTETRNVLGLDSSAPGRFTVAHLPSGETLAKSRIGVSITRLRPLPSFPMRTMKLLVASSDLKTRSDPANDTRSAFWAMRRGGALRSVGASQISDMPSAVFALKAISFSSRDTVNCVTDR